MSFVLVAACGGTKKDNTTNRKVADDLDVEKGLTKNPDAKATGPDGGVGELPTNDAGATAAAVDAGAITDPNAPFVTFRLKNSTSKDITLNLNKGWSIVIFAYSGDPKQKTAKSIQMFPKHCTVACSTAKADRCPICKKPRGNKNERDAQKREVIAPGQHLDVKWDGSVHTNKRTRGKRGRRCKCFDTKKVADNTYTVKAVGLHITTSAKKRSKLFLAESTMTTDGVTKQVVVLEFKKKPKKKKKP